MAATHGGHCHRDEWDDLNLSAGPCMLASVGSRPALSGSLLSSARMPSSLIETVRSPTRRARGELQRALAVGRMRRAGQSLAGAASEPHVQRIARVLCEASRRPAGHERGWVERIEARRAALVASKEVVRFTDFGAGGPDVMRSAGEMDQGVTAASTVGAICRSASKPPEWCLLLLRMVRELRPQTCLELGSCVGLSAAYQAAGLVLCGNTGRLVTLEGATPLAAVARETIEELGLAERAEVRLGRFQDTLDDALRDLETVDLAFIDGHHDEDATVAYFNEIAPYMARDGVVIFDDINWSPGMRRAWHTIVTDSRTGESVDMGGVGLALMDDDPPGLQ